ncbi:MAG: glycosyl hydrolase family 88 [Firmicutes bacterium]|nr:glycosyl hydrolase family 88 [Bacillota bacterium]
MNPLLAEKERFITRNEVKTYIDLLIENLINIKDETGEFLLKLEDGRVIDTKGWSGWEWTHGIGLYGMYKYYEMTKDKKAYEIICEWFNARLTEGTPTKNVNTVAPFITLAYLYELTGDKSFVPYLETWADWVMYEMPRTDDGGLQHIVYNSANHQQLWDDTLMMSVLPLAKIGKTLGKPEYIEEAKKQFLIHIKYLCDNRTGLWFHGWSFEEKHNFAQALWARGNCWITVAIPEFIELLDLKAGDFLRDYLITVLENQIKALEKYQDVSGLWHTLIDDENSYLETSAAAGFAYGIMKAVRKRYISERYREIGLKAVQGVVKNINCNGELQNVSFGTALGRELDYYRQIPLTSMPYGQAMAILCLTELLHDYI